MKHSLSDKDVELRTAECSVCGPVKISKAGNGWACAERHKATVRAYKARNPDRDRTSKTEHALLQQSSTTRRGVCTKCGPVEIVPNGRGFMCGDRAIELGRVSPQARPQTYCGSCKLLDHDIVWLRSDGSCPRCSDTDLNAMFAGQAADERLMGDVAEEFGGGFMVTGPWADPYEMPVLESAVPGWKTLG